MALRRAAGATFAAAVGAGGLCAYRYEHDDGFRRAVRLYSEVGPVVAHYRWVEAKLKYGPRWLVKREQESDDAYLQLDERYSDQVVALLKDLKGMYTKYGQIGAGMTNTFSEAWTEKLRELEDAVPPQPLDVVMQTLREEFGKDPMEVFEYFEETPLGSASIGQVHRARLAGSHEPCCVKVQYPDSQRMFREDMHTIRSFMELAAPEQVIILDELEASFEREFDYLVEAENLGRFHRELTMFDHEAKVPRPIAATSRVLVMELLDGVKLLDGVRSYAREVAAKQGKTLEELEREFKERLMREGAPERYTGPPAWQVALYLRSVRVRDAVVNGGVWAVNTVLSAFTGKRVSYWHTTLPPNAPRIVDTLMRVHGHQLMRMGAFNADPHAGNFMLLRDDRIGLIDFGATKVLTRGERLAACLLYAAIYRNDKSMLLDMVRVSGYRSKNFDEDVIWDLVRFGFDTFGQDLLRGKNVQQFMDDLYARDPWYESASNLTMAQFLSIRLRGVAMTLNHPVRCSDWWGPLAEQVLAEEGVPYESWSRAVMQERFGPVTKAKGAATSRLASMFNGS